MCSKENNFTSEVLNIDSFIDLFLYEPLEKNALYINVDHETLIEILIKAVYKLWGVKDLSSITLEMFDEIQKYFYSFGYKIHYEKAESESGNSPAFNVGFSRI